MRFLALAAGVFFSLCLAATTVQAEYLARTTFAATTRDDRSAVVTVTLRLDKRMEIELRAYDDLSYAPTLSNPLTYTSSTYTRRITQASFGTLFADVRSLSIAPLDVVSRDAVCWVYPTPLSATEELIVLRDYDWESKEFLGNPQLVDRHWCWNPLQVTPQSAAAQRTALRLRTKLKTLAIDHLRFRIKSASP